MDYSRDALLDDFSLQTLKDRYQLPGEDSPQDAFARAAAAFADDEAHAQRLYDYVSRKWFMFATPLLSNGGAERGLPISCFLTAVGDSREAISEHYDEVIWMSSMGGGIGADWSELRSDGEKTSKGSSSTGIMPFIAVDDRLILAVSQGGTRRGSMACYLDIDHPEIEQFIVGRKATGGDENRKFTNLHNAVNVTDEFMVCLREDRPFALRSPKTGEVIRTVNPRHLWKLIIETRMQTGEPYLHFIDSSNRALPEPLRRKGLRVRQSNLCVAAGTEILTREGHLPIEALCGLVGGVEVWNGQGWSHTEVVQTGDDQELMRVWFSDGGYLDVTPYHKFYTEAGDEVRAAELTVGTRLEPTNHPQIDDDKHVLVKDAEAYAAGWATASGYEDENRLAVFVPGRLSDAVRRRLMIPSVDMAAVSDGFQVRYEPRSIPSGVVPFRWNMLARWMWLGGMLDAVGEWVRPEGSRFFALQTQDAELVKEMRLMALEAGLRPQIRLTDAGNAFMLCAADVTKLVRAGAMLTQVPIDDATYPVQQLTITDVHPLPWRGATYCVNEPVRHRATFNGVLTGNCTEITLPTGIDPVTGKKRTAVCCLSSVNAETWEEWKDHPLFIEDLMRMLDNTLQVFIENAPAGLSAAVYSATMERSVGLGLLGFHSLLQKNGIAFEAPEAKVVNKQLFTHLRLQADAASLKLGVERGEAPDMAGTGERFAHKLALAPNASSSICLGTSPSTELIPANIYLHKTLSGSFAVKNRHLCAALADYDMDTQEVWRSITKHEGSIQHFTVELIKELFGKKVPQSWLDWLLPVFKIATEVDQMVVVEMAGDRSTDLDQAQSTNIFVPAGADALYLTKLHYMAWELGVKSLYYLRSTAAKRAENVNTMVERKRVTAYDPIPGYEHLDLGEVVRAVLAIPLDERLRQLKEAVGVPATGDELPPELIGSTCEACEG